jgi:hypothetical protein
MQIYFDYRRILMAAARARTNQTEDYHLLEDILQSIKIAVDDQKHNFSQYIQAAQAQGLSQQERLTLAKETLATHVSLRTLYRWAHEYLPEEAFSLT